MAKIIFSALLLIHAFIHFLGFIKAFKIAEINQLTSNISKSSGAIWAITGMLLVISMIVYMFQKDWWVLIAIVAAVLSQLLIVIYWQDAKFGTIANIIILIVAGLSAGNILFEKTFLKDVKSNLHSNNKLVNEIISDKDLEILPLPVQRYLRYSGLVNKPKVSNVRILFEGEMRNTDKDWFSFTTEQYNFFGEPTRLFFMKAKMFGLMVPGYHKYSNATATMDIRLFGIFSIIKESGDIMNKTETVTLFNDMCLMAPATLIDKRIEWIEIDANSVKAIFTNHDITISATLSFNDQGQLVNFVSHDRTSISDMKQYPFSTPVSDYKSMHGFNVMSKGEAIWHYPEGEFAYGRFVLKEIDYNQSSEVFK